MDFNIIGQHYAAFRVPQMEFGMGLEYLGKIIAENPLLEMRDESDFAENSSFRPKFVVLKNNMQKYILRS